MNAIRNALALGVILGSGLLASCSDQGSSSPAPQTKAAPIAAGPVAQASAPIASASPAQTEVKILRWGPHGTTAGQGFSIQPNGDSAIWFEARGIYNANLVEVWFRDQKLDGLAIKAGEGGSAQVPPSLIEKPGTFPVYLVLKPEGRRVELGTFEVVAK